MGRQSSKKSKDAWLERNKHLRPGINLGWRLRNRYGISEERFQEILETQNGTCAICRVPFVGFKEEPKVNRVHIDHDHETHWVRGFLCSNCNLGIGNLKDSIENLQSAIAYLTSTATPSNFVFSKIPNPKRKHTKEFKEEARKRLLGNTLNVGKEPW